MSSQGTGSVIAYGYERHLLDSWGAWSRSGDLGLGYGSGYAPVGLFTGSGVGIMFSDAEIMRADAAICALDLADRQIIKKVYLHRKWLGISTEVISGAVMAFSVALSGIAESY